MRARLRAASEWRDAGTTLTEMVVVMLIMSIVVVTTVSLTISLGRTTAQNSARQDQIDVGRIAVERLSKTARTAVKPSQLQPTCDTACGEVDAFLQGGSYSMKFYANLDNVSNLVGPSQVTYTLATTGTDAGVLVEKVQTPDPVAVPGNPPPTGYTYCNAEATGATGACKSRLTVRRLATGVQTGTPVFTYYQANGDPLPASASGLTADQLEKVMAIEVQLTVKSPSASAPGATTYIQRITLPNAQAILQGEDKTP